LAYWRVNVMTTAGTTVDDRTFGTDSDVVQIKRYPNRRFYDRTKRKYVTLADIEDLVRNGQTLSVRDSKSDEDLTRVVLTQILLERHPERMEMFPIAFLHLMLRANDLAQEFLRVFLRLSLATLESFQGTRTVSPFVSPFDWMRMFFPGYPPGVRRTEESSDPTVEVLSRRVAELEARLRQLESGAGSVVDQGAYSDHKPRHVRELEDRPSR
jgi:polyhydroxyalkanoate synthesis repressor PhaR